jgi:RND superfamily putative drug exporter
MVLFDFSHRRRAGRVPRGGSARSPSLAYERWTRLVVRFRWLVLACWLAAIAGGAYVSLLLPAHLANSFSVPGTDAERAETVLAHAYGERPEGTFTVVFRVRHSSDVEVQRRLRERLERAARVLPGAHVGFLRTGAGVVSLDVGTSLGLQQAKAYTGPLRRQLDVPGAPAALVTGEPAIQHDLDPRLTADLRRGELLAVPFALLVLAVVLGLSVALVVPFVFAAGTISATLALLYVAARLVPVTSYATNVVGLIGLGLAVDYSLLVLCRYREELACGGRREEAVVRTMATAGRAVVFSGVAVAIGLSGLLLVPVPFVRTLGLGGLLIPLVSILAALTLQPALLSLCGRRALAGVTLRRSTQPGREPWAVIARTVLRRPLAVFVLTTVVLLTAAVPALFLRLGPGSLTALPSATESTRGLAALTRSFGAGALTPTHVVVDAGRAGEAGRPAVHAAVERLADRLFHDPEVAVVATGSNRPYLSRDRRYARVIVIGRHEYGSPATRQLVDRLRGTFVPSARFPDGTRVLAGGAAPKGADFLTRLYAFFPWLVLVTLSITYVVLARAFRSLVLPLEAVLCNLLSVAASYGLLVAVFRFGLGAGVLGLHPAAQIEGWVPVFLFVMLFGLSMDYEVFLVSRMRESWDERHDNAEAVAFGLERTGRVITAAALVMTVSFAGLMVGGVPGLQQLGLGLALAVLIDATFVRALLVPSSMALLGRWNWWLPVGRRRSPALRLEKALHEP